MTDFMAAHPGGAGRIAMVEGQDLSKFWDVYKLHHREHIAALMGSFRIGSLSPEDYATVKGETHFDNPYANDPPRALHPRARIASTCPWNAEPPVDELQKTFVTPNELFFVRNHNPVPDIDPDAWRLTVEACPELGIPQPTQFSLQDLLGRLPRHEVLATLQCAGNRQRDFIEEGRPLYVAPSWENGAMGTARWAGVRVRDLLRACGADVDALALGTKSAGDARIVNFIAEDVSRLPPIPTPPAPPRRPAARFRPTHPHYWRLQCRRLSAAALRTLPRFARPRARLFVFLPLSCPGPPLAARRRESATPRGGGGPRGAAGGRDRDAVRERACSNVLLILNLNSKI